MEIKILFDSNAIKDIFSTGWGFSCLVNNSVLFDTGENSEYLLANMKQMNVSIEQIEAVVISHEHWDHIDGLWGLLQQKNTLDVYVCPGFSAEFKAKIGLLGGTVIESERHENIKENIYVTGEMQCTYKGAFTPEQALVIKTNKGINIVTGCSHPGILSVLRNVMQRYPKEQINLVAGGFHLKDKSEDEIENIVDNFKELGVNTVGPTHCSGELAKKIFVQRYNNNLCKLQAGTTIEI